MTGHDEHAQKIWGERGVTFVSVYHQTFLFLLNRSQSAYKKKMKLKENRNGKSENCCLL